MEWFLNDADMQKKVCYIHESVCTKDNDEWKANGIFVIDFNCLLYNNEDEVIEKYFVAKSTCVY